MLLLLLGLIQPCHAGGREFESRRSATKEPKLQSVSLTADTLFSLGSRQKAHLDPGLFLGPLGEFARAPRGNEARSHDSRPHQHVENKNLYCVPRTPRTPTRNPK
jgi:hypothetical protein